MFSFIYKLGRFPGDQNLAVIPQGDTPSFIDTVDIISPNKLYKKFGTTDEHGLVSVQFLASFNRYLGGSIDISKELMTECFHNLSMQTLSISNHEVIVRFNAIFTMVKNIVHLRQNRINESINTKRQKSEDLA